MDRFWIGSPYSESQQTMTFFKRAIEMHKTTFFQLLIAVTALLFPFSGRSVAAAAAETAGAEANAPAAVFTVNQTDDTDDGACSALYCTLCEAINAANATEVHDTILFDFTERTTFLPTPSPSTADENDRFLPQSWTTPADLKVALSDALARADSVRLSTGGNRPA